VPAAKKHKERKKIRIRPAAFPTPIRAIIVIRGRLLISNQPLITQISRMGFGSDRKQAPSEGKFAFIPFALLRSLRVFAALFSPRPSRA
jgi:hypothetical protein